MKTLFYILLRQTIVCVPQTLSAPIPFVFTPYLYSTALHNMNLPNCIDCIHFQKNYWNNYQSKCKYFGEKNMITGIIEYEYAADCRSDDKKCGIEGKHFQMYRSDDFPKRLEDE